MPVHRFYVGRIETKEGQVPAVALDDAQFAVGDQFLLRLAVAHGEEHIFAYRHDERLGLNAAQGFGDSTPPISVVSRRSSIDFLSSSITTFSRLLLQGPYDSYHKTY